MHLQPSHQGIIYHISAVTPPNYLPRLSPLRSHLGTQQMPSEAGMESGGGVVEAVGVGECGYKCQFISD